MVKLTLVTLLKLVPVELFWVMVNVMNQPHFSFQCLKKDPPLIRNNCSIVFTFFKFILGTPHLGFLTIQQITVIMWIFFS